MLYLIFSEEGGKKKNDSFMEWNLNCLRAIAELRTPLLDTLMQGVTELGGETLFMLFMLVIFWCVDKKKGLFSHAPVLHRHGGQPDAEDHVLHPAALGARPLV